MAGFRMRDPKKDPLCLRKARATKPCACLTLRFRLAVFPMSSTTLCQSPEAPYTVSSHHHSICFGPPFQFRFQCAYGLQVVLSRLSFCSLVSPDG